MTSTVNYRTFSQVIAYVESSKKNIEKIQKSLLKKLWEHIRDVIRDSHWKYWPWWLRSTTSPDSPLLKTWRLRKSVVYGLNMDSVDIFSQQEWLAMIHEYWVTYKMTESQRKYLFWVVFKDQPKIKWKARKTWGTWMITIPPRPIWRLALAKELSAIEKLFEDYYENSFI